MAKVILICGRICCGKTTYARRLRAESGGVVLSVDEIMLSLFGQSAGEKHDEYTGRLQRLLFEKSLEILAAGVNVLLDWGFWTKEARARAREFYKSRGIACEFHYIDIGDETWRERIDRRNRMAASGETAAYILDSGLEAKCLSLFEVPEQDEIDVWVRQ